MHWADVSDGNQGLCIFCDHTTGYIHGGETSFGLALAWGYEGGYWWGLQSMQGSHELRYQIMAHDGEWQQAGLWHECERFLHQPSARRSAYAPEQNSSSIFRIQTEGVELGAFYYKDGGYYVRVFNASGQDEAVFRLNNDYFTKMEETGPDGTPFGRSIPSGEDSKDVFKDEIPPFGIRTYRLTK